MRMNWMRGSRVGNMGDLFGPILTAAFSGQPVTFAKSQSLRQRLITVGTIGQMQRFGHVDIWGSGFDSPGQSSFHVQTALQHPPLTRFAPHAVRGPFTAALLRRAGYVVPAIYGDPAWLLPRLWPGDAVAKRWDLGVVIHTSEVVRMDPAAGARPEFRRYAVPDTMKNSVVVLNTVVEREIGQVRLRIEDILSCRRILATSLHALAVAEAYGIPCATFDFHDGASGRVAVDDDGVPLDHRMRDFYAGSGRQDVLVYRAERHQETDWDDAIGFIDRNWMPLSYDPSGLLDSFPKHLGQLRDAPEAAILARLSSLAPLKV